MVFGRKKKVEEEQPVRTPVIEASSGKKGVASVEVKEEEKELIRLAEAFQNEYLGVFVPNDFVKFSDSEYKAQVCALLFAIFGELRKLRELMEIINQQE